MLQPLPEQLAIKRFWHKFTVAGEDECWVWNAALFRGFPYGAIKSDGKLWSAHRFMFEHFCGHIPDGLNVLHRCDNPPCVNPNHLFLGTLKDNADDMVSKNRHARGAQAPNWREKIKDYPKIGIDRLTPEQEKEIVADPRTGVVLAPIYGVHRSTIDRVRKKHGASRPPGPPPFSEVSRSWRSSASKRRS